MIKGWRLKKMTNDKIVFMVMGLLSLIGMFYLDWKMALCIFLLLWSDRYLRSVV